MGDGVGNPITGAIPGDNDILFEDDTLGGRITFYNKEPPSLPPVKTYPAIERALTSLNDVYLLSGIIDADGTLLQGNGTEIIITHVPLTGDYTIDLTNQAPAGSIVIPTITPDVVDINANNTYEMSEWRFVSILSGSNAQVVYRVVDWANTPVETKVYFQITARK